MIALLEDFMMKDEIISFELSTVLTPSAALQSTITSGANSFEIYSEINTDSISDNTTSEITATNLFENLIVDAIDEKEEEFIGNSCYIINDLSFDLSTEAINAGGFGFFSEAQLLVANVNNYGNVDTLYALLILGYYAYRAAIKNIIDYLNNI